MILLLLFVISCSDHQRKSRVEAISYYFWKTKTGASYLNNLNKPEKIYVRLFDVKIINNQIKQIIE